MLMSMFGHVQQKILKIRADMRAGMQITYPSVYALSSTSNFGICAKAAAEQRMETYLPSLTGWMDREELSSVVHYF